MTDCEHESKLLKILAKSLSTLYCIVYSYCEYCWLTLKYKRHSFMDAGPSIKYSRSHCSCCFDSVGICMLLNVDCNGHLIVYPASCELVAVIRLWCAKVSSATEIHQKLCLVHGRTMSEGNVRHWCRGF